MKKLLMALTVLLTLSLTLAGCDNSKNPSTDEPNNNTDLETLLENTIDATITLDNGDMIELVLYPDLAPETVENFVYLANSGFYDGTIFHRVIDGFIIQGGGYDEDLNRLDADSIFGEFKSNGFNNELSHERGVISMARIANDPDSASSQFFIVVEDAKSLDGEYAAFGKVKDEESLKVIDDIASVRTGSVESAGLDDVPVTSVIIDSVMVNSSSGMDSDFEDDVDIKYSTEDVSDDELAEIQEFLEKSEAANDNS